MDLSGRRLRNIEVRALLGRGGMGEVYRGFDLVLEREVALKVLRASLLDEVSRVRFLREARVLSLLDHPGICRIYDVIELEGQQVLVLEHVAGRTLDRLLKEGLPRRLQLAVARQLAEVLEAAHGQGIIHRDLKPDNVMVTESGAIKVLDFGLARHQDHDSLGGGAAPAIASAGDTRPLGGGADSSAVTQHGSVMGTAAYMSPEQARGDDLTTASDLFSLGVILQELFTGETAYPDDLPMMHKIQLAAAAQTRPVSGLEPQLSDLVERLKAAAPEARPRAADVVERLRQIEDRPRRRRRQLAAAAVVAAVVLAGWKHTVDLARERDRTVAALAEAEAERATAEEVTEFLVDVFRVSDPGRARGNAVTAREVLDRGAERLHGELDGQPALRARLGTVMGRVYHHLGLHDEAAALLTESVRLERELHPAGDPALARSLFSLAGVRYMQDRYDEAVDLFEESLEMERSRAEPNLAAVAHCLEELGQIRFEQGRLVEARQLLERSLELRARVLPADHPEVATGLWTLGLILHDEGELVEAETLFQRTLTMVEGTTGRDHPTYARVLESYGALLIDQARYSEAEPLFRESLAIRERILPPGHQNLAISASYLALVVWAEGSFAEAEALLRRALAIFETTLGPSHYNVGANLILLARLVLETGRLDEAEEIFRRSLTIWQEAGLEENYNAVVARQGLGEVAVRRGDLATAEEHLKLAVGGWGRTLGLDSVDGAQALAELAEVLHRRGSTEAAEGRWEQALEAGRTAVEKNPQSYEARAALCRIELGRGAALAAAGDGDGARRLWRSALDRVMALPARDRQVDLLAIRAEASLRLGDREGALPLLARLDGFGYRDPALDDLR